MTLPAVSTTARNVTSRTSLDQATCPSHLRVEELELVSLDYRLAQLRSFPLFRHHHVLDFLPFVEHIKQFDPDLEAVPREVADAA